MQVSIWMWDLTLKPDVVSWRITWEKNQITKVRTGSMVNLPKPDFPRTKICLLILDMPVKSF